jgi:hypothetical protein
MLLAIIKKSIISVSAEPEVCLYFIEVSLQLPETVVVLIAQSSFFFLYDPGANDAIIEIT